MPQKNALWLDRCDLLHVDAAISHEGLRNAVANGKSGWCRETSVTRA